MCFFLLCPPVLSTQTVKWLPSLSLPNYNYLHDCTSLQLDSLSRSLYLKIELGTKIIKLIHACNAKKERNVGRGHIKALEICAKFGAHDDKAGIIILLWSCNHSGITWPWHYHHHSSVVVMWPWRLPPWQLACECLKTSLCPMLVITNVGHRYCSRTSGRGPSTLTGTITPKACAYEWHCESLALGQSSFKIIQSSTMLNC